MKTKRMNCILAKVSAAVEERTNTTIRLIWKMIRRLIRMKPQTKTLTCKSSKNRKRKRKPSARWSWNPPRNNKRLPQRAPRKSKQSA